MKKLFPDAPDVPQSVANRGSKIVDKYLRVHRVEKAKDLPEEAKVRLYRDLRFFLESGGQPLDPGTGGAMSGFKRFCSGLWTKIKDFLSMSESDRPIGPVSIFMLQACALAWPSVSMRPDYTLPGDRGANAE